MDFKDTGCWIDWVEYSGQRDRSVTYIFVASKPIARLRGESDILYIGKTDGEIRKRFKDETENNNTPKNTQATNIRMTHVFRQLNLAGISYTCFFVEKTTLHLPSEIERTFAEKLRTWDKNAYVRMTRMADFSMPTMEKYLLITYADEHLELPPLNNSF